MDWAKVREEFPVLREWTYLNTASFGLVPTRARKAVHAHFDRRDTLANQDFLEWFDDLDEIRGLVGQLIHCDAADIAFAPNASTPLSLFLGGIEWQPGDVIATMENEFPNHYSYPGFLSPGGVRLLELDDLSVSLPPNTRAVIASTVSYSTGRVADVRRLREMADAAGALLYLDGTQSVGALQFDVPSIRPDMMAVDCYKWMLSPNGAAFFYISPELRKTLQPAVIGWRSDREWRQVSALHNGAPRFSDTAERYEGGMLSFAPLYGMGETLRMLLEIGPAAIETRVLELSAMMGSILKNAGAEIFFENSNILAASFAGRDMAALAAEFKAEKILAAVRHGRLRVSCHFYNSEEDFNVLAQKLA